MKAYPEGWLTLLKAIPRGLTADLATFIGREAGTVRRWREPIEHGLAGTESFLDMFYRVAAALHHLNNGGYYELKVHMNAYFNSLERGAVERWDDHRAGADISKENNDFVQAVFRRATLEEKRQELEESIAISQAHLARLNAEIAARKAMNAPMERPVRLEGVMPSNGSGGRVKARRA